MIVFHSENGSIYNIEIDTYDGSTSGTFISIYSNNIGFEGIFNIENIINNSEWWKEIFIRGFYSHPPLPKDLKHYIEKIIKLKAFI